MSTVLFDTLKFTEKLQSGGFTQEQSRAVSLAVSESLAEFVANQPTATKSDVDSVRLALREESGVLRNDIEALKIETKAGLAALDLETKAGLAALDLETKAGLTTLELKLQAQIKDVQIRIGGMIMALGGVLIAIKYFG